VGARLSATAVLVVLCFWRFGLSADAVIASFACAVLVVLSAIDLEKRIVPNRIVLPAAAIVLVAQTLVHPSVEWVLSGLGAALFLFVAALVYPAGMGMGDVKLALLIGFLVGTNVLWALFIAFVASLVPIAVLFVRHGAEARKMGIPFAPFMALGGVFVLLLS
jgi:leader peptidase (prepilin peptidase)/N-methyltransferase